jgi:GT2 family glycosyltransferase
LKEDLNIVVVTYKNRDLLEKCVRSIYASLQSIKLKSVITVVDNASHDGTRELVLGMFPDVNYIENKENLGLAQALNIGILSRREAQYTLLLNDDVELFPDTLKFMFDTIEQNPDAWGVPANLFRPDGSEQKMKLGIIGLHRLRKGQIRKVSFGGTTACLYRTAVLMKLGLFDVFYFFYNEDLDFSLRAKRKGIYFVFNPNVKVIHYKGYGRRKGEKQIKPYFYATNYYFFRKNYGIPAATFFLIMAFAHIFVWKRRFGKEKDWAKLALLQRGKEKLLYTVNNFKQLLRDSGAPQT